MREEKFHIYLNDDEYKVGSSLVPFANKFPKNTKLYKLMTTKPGEGA